MPDASAAADAHRRGAFFHTRLAPAGRFQQPVSVPQTMLSDLINRVRQDLRTGRFASEAAVSQGVVLPVLHELGWPVFDTRIVVPQFTIESRRVDYALCDRLQRPLVFIEVKRVGLAEGGDRQLFEYAFLHGVQLALLTDGQEWSLYLPTEAGSIDDRRAYKLDLLERDPLESQERLERYLSFGRVSDGSALKAARDDHHDVARTRMVRDTMPRGWEALIAEQDELLLELLAEKVEDLCGYRPDKDVCSAFLTSLSAPSATVGGGVVARQPAGNLSPVSTGTGPQLAGAGFSWNGARVRAGSAREVLQELLLAFHRHDATFLERFAARKHGRKRRFVSRDRAELYPGRPDLARDFAVELVAGWWLGTNYSRKSIQEIIDLACEVANVRVAELKVSFGS
ncbi:MAG: hypothetical protein NW201_12725 [Gemmatimonadales bacterium]|nr:hypothetical protein [Gemmatimonadales bacterium]